MHFHLPKPLHGWRTFAGEIAIVVIGVLIALGAQQVVENRADRARADSAIAALKYEGADLDFYASEIEITAPCVLSQIAAIQNKLVSGDQALLPRYSDASTNGFVLRMPYRIWSQSVWQSVSASDVLRQMEPARNLLLSDLYTQAQGRLVGVQSTRAWVADLNALSVLAAISDADRLRYVGVTEHLRGEVQQSDLVAGQMRDTLAAAGLLAPQRKLQKDFSESGTIKFCQEHGLPLAKLRPAIPANAD